MDSQLINACRKIISDRGRCSAIEFKFAGRALSEAAAREVHEIVCEARDDMYYVENTRAMSLAECRAKAEVLSLIEHEGIALSLGKDVIANISKSGNVVNLSSFSALDECL